jgi:hypothetical protein
MKLSSELPDDKGEVFVTAHVGSKMQVMGRRCPDIGELCLSQIFFQDEQRTPWSQEDLDAMFGRVADKGAFFLSTDGLMIKQARLGYRHRYGLEQRKKTSGFNIHSIKYTNTTKNSARAPACKKTNEIALFA